MRGLVRMQLAATLLTLAAAHDARAEEQKPPPPLVTVAWTGPPGCPDSAAIDVAIATLLRTSTKQGPHVDARVVVVRQPGDRYRAEVRTRSDGREGRRTFQAATCGSLADATALLLALMIDPNAAPPPVPSPAAAPPPPAEAPPPLTPPPPPEPVTAPRPSRSPSPSVPPRWSLSPRVQLGAIVDVGTFPGAQFGVEAELGLDYGPLLLLLGGAVWPSTSYGEVGNGVTGSLSLVGAHLSACARPLALVSSRFPLWVCFGPGYEHQSADFPDLALALEHQSRDWASLVFGLAVEPRLGIFGLQFRADATVPLRRDGFVDSGNGDIFTPGPVAFRGSAGLVVHFP